MIPAGARSEDIKFAQNTASLIDVVFLLLIYFLMTASLLQREGDIGFLIPVRDVGRIEELPVEALIQVRQSGVVELEGQRFGPADRALKDLSRQLNGLRLLARSQGAGFSVSIKPDAEARHGRIIDVMDACAEAEVAHLGFTPSD